MGGGKICCEFGRARCGGDWATTTRDTERATTKPRTATCTAISNRTATISQIVLVERFAMHWNQD
jgi:hypothetical protein